MCKQGYEESLSMIIVFALADVYPADATEHIVFKEQYGPKLVKDRWYVVNLDGTQLHEAGDVLPKTE